MTSHNINKIKRKLWSILVSHTRYKKLYPYIYKSYWHFIFHKPNSKTNHNCYYSARPNPGAGIGHQIANWIAGYWYAKQFGLKFAHIPFSTKKWDDFLGFGNDEPLVSELKKQGYKIRKLPLFSEKNTNEIQLNRLIIQSYAGKKVVFVAEQDQFYKNQYGVMEDIQRKFYTAPARKNDHLIYSKRNFNIAIHVRRGDIMTDPNNPNLTMRYLSNDYFEKMKSLKIGQDIVLDTIPIYVSSSAKKTIYNYGDTKDQILFRINIPKNSHILRFPSFDGIEQCIMKSDAKFRVIDNQEYNNNFHYIRNYLNFLLNNL